MRPYTVAHAAHASKTPLIAGIVGGLLGLGGGFILGPLFIGLGIPPHQVP
jgi:uncharacterized membrane protein YfcA